MSASDSLPGRYTIMNDQTEPLGNISKYFSARIIRVDPTTHRQIGGYVDEFAYLPNQLIVVSRSAGTVSAIDDEGRLLWQLKAGSSPIDMFQHLHLFAFNSKKSRIEIYDDHRKRLFLFNLNGQYIDSFSIDVMANDFIPLDDDCWLFSLVDHPASRVEGLDGVYELIQICRDSSRVTGWKKRPPIPEDVVPFTDFDEFSQFNNNYYYNRSLSDSIFHVQPPFPLAVRHTLPTVIIVRR